MMRTAIVACGAAALLSACTPLEMGTASRNLSELQKQQQSCRTSTGDFSKAYQNEEQMRECQATSLGLAKLHDDMLKLAKKPDTDARNAVYYYRIAATAAWQSFDPNVMENAREAARSGLELCEGPDRNSLQPGDCATLGIVAPLVGQDIATLRFNRLKAMAANMPAGPTNAEKLAARRKALLSAVIPDDGTAPTPGATRLGANARLLFEDGWRALAARWSLLKNDRVHPSMCKYAVDQETEIVGNLKSRFDELRDTYPVGTRPEPPADATWKTSCKVVPGTDRAPVDVSLPDDIAGEDLAGQVHRLTWCLWKTAEMTKKEKRSNAATFCSSPTGN